MINQPLSVIKEKDPINVKSVAYLGVYNRVYKRIFDLVFAIILFSLLIPLLLVISAIVVIDSGFPILYCAERGGYHGKTFRIYKYRTMVKNADRIGGDTTALNDPRITKVGRILRKAKIDECPQLFNIIKGDMSFIGPRPEILKYVNMFEGVEKLILEVRPGITDYSSLKFINLDEIVGITNADEVFEQNILKQKNILRVHYVTTISLKTDASIFYKTVQAVVKKTFC